MDQIETAVVAVTDAFAIRPNMPGSDHEPGLIVVFDGRQCGFSLPELGTSVELLRPEGTTFKCAVTEMKEHGDGRSFFFPGLKHEDAPIGTIISWRVNRMAAAPKLQTAGRAGAR